jgi:hypothetical protein
MKHFFKHKQHDNNTSINAGVLPPAEYFERLIVSDVDGDIDPSAIFEVKSENGGFLLPRLTNDQKLQVTATPGLMVFDTDSKRANTYAEGEWIPLEDGTVKKIEAGEGFDFQAITEEGSISLPNVITAQTITSPSSIEVDKHGRVLSLITGPSLTKVVGSKTDTQMVSGIPDFTVVQWGANDFIGITVKNSLSYLTDLTINIGIGSLDNAKKYIQGIFEYSDDEKASWKPFGQLPTPAGLATACHFGSVINPANTDGLTLLSYSSRALITTPTVPTGNKLYFRVKLRSHSTAVLNKFTINGTFLTTSANNIVMNSTFSATVSE